MAPSRKIQAVRVHRGLGSAVRTGNDFGNGWQLEHLPDFVLSSDPWFRPVAMCFGPEDGSNGLCDDTWGVQRRTRHDQKRS